MNSSGRGPWLVGAVTVVMVAAAFAAVQLTSGKTAKALALATLVADQQTYLGREVATSDTVRRFTVRTPAPTTR